MIIFPSEHHVVGDLGTVLEFAALKPNTSILLCEQIEEQDYAGVTIFGEK